ncbi:MAG: FAD binding domain-containing protein, partial [Chloroflexi bacterium]|nr:FAD binding domain-containing protein [Chloroflexota bacterium]
MMRLPPFTYLAPKNVDDAIKLLSDHGAGAMLVAGGTDLFPNMKRRQFTPKFLVGLNALAELRGVKKENGDLVIGVGTTLTQLSNHQITQSLFPALTTAASLVSSPQLRNAGTIGGNLCLDTRCNYYNQSFFWRKAIGFCMKKDGEICWVAPGGKRCWAISSTDCAPVAIALDARVRLVGPNGAREIAAEDLYRDDGIDFLAKQPNEILTELILPRADGLKS